MRAWLAAAVAVVAVGCARPAAPMPAAPTPAELIASKADLLGEAALHQPGGASYEYFENLLPPMRYVDADFRTYPIVLSAPGAKIKGRLISDGSAINALARQPNWINEQGTPVHVLVGERRERFSCDRPILLQGYLPSVQLCAGEYQQEAFASTDAALEGAVLARFDFPAANAGRIELRLESGYEQWIAKDGVLRDPAGKVRATFDSNWEFNGFRSALVSKLEHAKAAAVMIMTEPTGGSVPVATVEFYDAQKQACGDRWQRILAGGMEVETPEPIVNRAWRAVIIGTQMIQWGDQLNYSAGNQYARQYANESGDTMRSMVLWGQTKAARKALEPLLRYRRPASLLHDAAFNLEDLADYYFQTRDAALIEHLRPLWQGEVDLLLKARQADGLLPKERYCSDIALPVRSLNNNANAWRGLRDMSIVLADCGYTEESARLARIAAEYKPLILAAMEKAIVRSVDPPWVPVALDGEEPPANPITATRLGSYWNLVIPCVLWSGIFPIDSEPADAILHTIQRNGGLCMGLTRVQSARAAWINRQNIDDLYVIRYSLALLKRDEVERALVTFYAKLAHGLTRGTFIGCESSGIEPLDAHGRQMGLPPNSTSNASFLMQLRYLLVQDWDMDDDGRAETLNLAFATPRAWLGKGKRIVVKNAPTAFGPLSFELRRDGDLVQAEIELPPLAPRRVRLRLRTPESEKTVDLTGRSGHVSLAVNLK